MFQTLKNKEIIDIYKDLIDAHYSEPDETAVVGSFLHHTIFLPLPKKPAKVTENRKSKQDTEITEIKNIRSFFSTERQPAKKKKKNTPKVINID